MSKQARLVILCEAYRSIEYPLYILESEKPDVPVTIFITALEDLYHLFQVLNEKVLNNSLELIYYPPYKSRWRQKKCIKKWFYLLPDILNERCNIRRFFNNHFKDLEGATIIFSSPGYTGIKIYALRRLSKRNRLIYRKSAPPYMGRYSPKSLRDIVTLLMYKITYSKDTQIGQYPADRPYTKGFPLMPDSFMKDSVDSVIDWSNRAELMKDFAWEKYSVFNTGDVKVIYFHQDLVDRYVPDRDTFKRELDEIFKVVLKHFPEKEIARKYHPSHEHNKDIVTTGEEIPVYIPAELLYSNSIKVYLGISSSAIANVRGGQAISLIELITYTDEGAKKQLKEILINSSLSEVLFPASLEELEQILIKIRNQ